MIRQNTRTKWIIWYAIATHITWAILLLIDDRASWVTAISSLARLTDNHYVDSAILFAVAAMALAPMIRSSEDGFIDLLLVIPQQFMLFLSAGGAIEAIVKSAFADGVVRPRAFIAADQLPSILMAFFHSLAILEIHGRHLWESLLSSPQSSPSSSAAGR